MEAEQLFERCIVLIMSQFVEIRSRKEDPNEQMIKAYTQMGHCQRKQCKFKQAIETYTKVVELQPNSPEIAGLLGKLHSNEGNRSLALEYLNFAIEIESIK